MSKQFYFKHFSLALVHSLNIKTVLFQVTQLSISTHFSYIWPIDRTLFGATTPSQSRPGSDGSEGLLHIPESSSITWASPSDCLESYQDTRRKGVLPLCRGAGRCILRPQPTGQADFRVLGKKYTHTHTYIYTLIFNNFSFLKESCNNAFQMEVPVA